ncbi:MAG: HEAT repeat domain-containing protein, partial [Pseudomonadota bacterium]
MRVRIVSTLVLAGLLLASRSGLAVLWPSEVQRIERDLAASDVSVRRRAATRIVELGPKVGSRVALRALSDPDVVVRLSAAEAAQSLGVSDIGERVVGWLTHPDARVRLQAAELLSRAPSPRAVAPLTRALSDAEPSVRAAAADALGVSGAPEAVVGLLGRLDDSAIEVKVSVVRALSRLGDARAVVPLVSKIEDPRPEMRAAVARALGELGDARAVSALVLSLRDPDETVRAAALRALGELGDASVVPSMAALLAADESASVRKSAVNALADLGGSEAAAALVRALGERPEERDQFVRALGRLGVSAVPVLTACLSAGDVGGRTDGCALALAEVEGSGAGPVLRDAIRRGRVGPEAALMALAKSGHGDALPLVLEHLGNADPSVRRAALAAASALLDPERPDGRAVEPLERAFYAAKDRRSERLELLRLLGRTGSPRAGQTLGPIAARADDVEFRIAALEALGNAGPDAAPRVLLTALGDPEAGVRLAAALAIRKSPPAGSARVVVERLERAGPAERPTLALALFGALARDEATGVFPRVARVFEASREAERDALIEALGNAANGAGLALLRASAASAEPADRAKTAEALALLPEGRSALRALVRDPEPAVRANAVWSLGATGSADDLEVVTQAFADSDVASAANAVTAFARISVRARRDVRD